MSEEDFKLLRDFVGSMRHRRCPPAKEHADVVAALERLEGAMQVAEARAESLDLVLERTKTQAAAMREALGVALVAFGTPGVVAENRHKVREQMRAALAPGAGSALLERLRVKEAALATAEERLTHSAYAAQKKRADKAEAERDALRGQLATEEAERIRCRDGWAAASTEVERLRAALLDGIGALDLEGGADEVVGRMRAALGDE